jgi:hypothetical protein
LLVLTIVLGCGHFLGSEDITEVPTALRLLAPTLTDQPSATNRMTGCT